MKIAWAAITKIHRRETGVVSAEAVAVTAMFLVVAMVIGWLSLSAMLGDSMGVIGEELDDWIGATFP